MRRKEFELALQNTEAVVGAQISEEKIPERWRNCNSIYTNFGEQVRKKEPANFLLKLKASSR